MRLLSAPILLALPSSASAATLTVGAGGTHATIRAAVDAAAAGDRIEVQAGTWDEDAVVVDVDLTLVGLGGSASTLWNGPSGLLGFGAAPALVVRGGAVLTLEGFDLSGQSGEPSLVVDGAEVRAIDLLVDDQDAGFDILGGTRGAVQVTNGTLTCDACALEENSADAGGAVWADDSTITLTASLLRGNQAGQGGAIWARNSAVLLDGSQLEENEAEAGGAIRVEGGTLETQSGTFLANRGTTGGGWGGSACL